jgi:hypothetical protein
MTDWIIFLVGCFATLLCVVATAILVYAVETDVKDCKAFGENKLILGELAAPPWCRKEG